MSFTEFNLPDVVYRIAVSGGLIMGSQAMRCANGQSPLEDHDWDIMVPFADWEKVRMLIPMTATPNGFRGWRFEQGCWVDVWPDDLQRCFRQSVRHTGCPVYALDLQNRLMYSAAPVHTEDASPE